MRTELRVRARPNLFFARRGASATENAEDLECPSANWAKINSLGTCPAANEMLARKKDARDWSVHANLALPCRWRWIDVALVLRLASALHRGRVHRRRVILSLILPLSVSDEVLEVAHAIARVCEAAGPDRVFGEFVVDLVVEFVL